MATYSFKSVGEKPGDPKFTAQAERKMPIGIKTPIRLSQGKTVFLEMNYNLQDQLRDNFKNLLLTNKGERLGAHAFGADLFPLASEKLAQEDFDRQAMVQIKENVSLYMPFLSLKDMSSSTKTTSDTATTVHELTITYDIPSMRVSDDKIVVNIVCIG